MNTFEDMGLSPELMTAIKGMGITTPTKIQAKSIPHIMQGKDVMGESATGSGKTLAFGCGVIEQVIPKQGIQAVILAPTRELAEQVKDSLATLSYHKKLKIVTVYGGVSINPQIDALMSADVVVATPGRMLDHISRETIDLSNVKMLVLDEADRMLDMGFIDDVESIIMECPEEKQTLFFSATLAGVIGKLARNYMVDPVTVSAKVYVDPSKLSQIYYDVSRNMKISLLIHLLKEEKEGLVMVFCNTRRNTDFVVNNLKANKISATPIHGGLSQNKRIQTIKQFNNARVNVLVCTDVAARGLHIDNVSHVYNYEIPNDTKDYVHRIGRTARAGEEGSVINLLCDFDHDNFSRVVREHRDFNIERVEMPRIEKIRPVLSNDRRQRSFSHGRNNSGRFGGQRSRNDSRQNRPRRSNSQRRERPISVRTN